MTQCAGLRRPGAAALDLCYVAAGYTDGFFETGLAPRDAAAGSLLITEAGGLVGNFTGEADFLHRREMVAGNPKIYAQLVTMLAPFTSIVPAEAAAQPAPIADALTPEAALAATQSGVAAAATTPAEPAKKKVAVRIRKEPLARLERG